MLVDRGAVKCVHLHFLWKLHSNDGKELKKGTNTREETAVDEASNMF